MIEQSEPQGSYSADNIRCAPNGLHLNIMFLHTRRESSKTPLIVYGLAIDCPTAVGSHSFLPPEATNVQWRAKMFLSQDCQTCASNSKIDQVYLSPSSNGSIGEISDSGYVMESDMLLKILLEDVRTACHCRTANCADEGHQIYTTNGWDLS
ncbi:unnamed protein product [Timema podura]|uniref:Uncharacterized protein n=1 Tax=Timema podura TaxID=61482 RepID=A0ABN7P523_TIMPD|nr:unnamed protein product [Timema podura]